MIQLYFKDVFSILTAALVLALIFMSIYAHKHSDKISKWGRLTALFVIVGTAVSAFSAIRDHYMAEGAVFALNSMQSVICSAAGGAIFLAAIISIFIKNQHKKKAVFSLISILFVIQVVSIEVSRIILL